jgi:3-oxoacyl-[acyl-carrier protein] reductase
MGLANQVAMITGGGRGIGRAIAIAFAREGARVAVCARTEAQIAAVAAEIRVFGGIAGSYAVDVADEREVAEAVGRIEADLGVVDLLVNNAAILRLGSITETEPDLWDKLIRVNLRGPFVCSRAVLPGMMERRRGRIINIWSLAGRRGYEEQGAYCASKHGLVGLSKVLAIEAQPYDVYVNMVSPGGVLTDLSRELRESRGAADSSEWMTAEEVARAVVYIAKQDGAATTDEIVLRRFASEPWR